MGGKGRADEFPHAVRLSEFYIDTTLVTQEMYERVTGRNPSKKKAKDHPVEQVTWFGAIRFCNKCSEMEGLTPCYDRNTGACNFDADGYRLPTEAEWEYACRAGSSGEYGCGDRESELRQIRMVLGHGDAPSCREKDRTDGDFTTCTATSGSGATTGSGRHYTRVLRKIRAVRTPARCACCAAARGTPPEKCRAAFRSIKDRQSSPTLASARSQRISPRAPRKLPAQRRPRRCRGRSSRIPA